MYKIGEIEMVSCPYNRSHVVSKLRIQKHIIKCKNRYPEMKLVTCFYNYTHKLKPEDVLKHYEICSQKIRMEEARYCENNRYGCCVSSEVNDEYNFNSENYEKASLFSAHKTSSKKSDDTRDLRLKTIESRSQSLNDIDEKDNVDDLIPLNLPKTVSKAFTSIKQQTKNSSDLIPANQSVLPQSRGFGRGIKFFISPSKPPRTNDHLLPDVSEMDKGFPKKIKGKPKFFFNNGSDLGSTSSASVISSLFDDGITLKSDDMTFDDEDDGFIFKNFDKYVKI